MNPAAQDVAAPKSASAPRREIPYATTLLAVIAWRAKQRQQAGRERLASSQHQWLTLLAFLGIPDGQPGRPAFLPALSIDTVVATTRHLFSAGLLTTDASRHCILAPPALRLLHQEPEQVQAVHAALDYLARHLPIDNEPRLRAFCELATLWQLEAPDHNRQLTPISASRLAILVRLRNIYQLYGPDHTAPEASP